MKFVGKVRIIEDEGLFRSNNLSHDLGYVVDHGGTALLRNHGSLVVADELSDAVYLGGGMSPASIGAFEKSCRHISLPA
jgi:ribulose-5-phosphate 4-epimerase/fuculose-1-phosphate aldolase